MTRRKNRASRRANRRAIRMERLENRELLAADLMQNPSDPMDVNADNFITPLDAFELIGELNAGSDPNAPQERARPRFPDVNGDGVLSPLDAFSVVDALNRGRREAQNQTDRGSDEFRPNEATDDRGREADRAPGREERGPRGPQEDIEFQSIDGTNNNLASPELGSTGELLERWVASDYADGLSTPSGEDLPSAREVSNIVNASPGEIENSRGLSDLTWLFGQFLDHDITLTGEDHGGEAFNIEVPAGDAWFDPFGTGEVEIGLTRSGYEFDDADVRQQFNAITAYIDGSVIYGSDQERADALRSFEGGRLLVSEGNLLPFNEAGIANAGGTSDSLFLAGDIRANENAALSAMHTVWVREHNRVADRISSDNPDLSDEEVYQLARRFVTAELQSITYNEFLPAILGRNALPEYIGYDESVNPNISNVFAAAAYRFGHTMLSSELLRLNNDGTEADEGNISLQDAFFNPTALTENGIDSILLGAATQTAQEVDPFVVDDVRNFLFGPPGAGGFDLASLNIQRGRDHGLPSYNQVREEMGIGRVESFAEISSDTEIQSRLEQAYGEVDSIDAWVGMLAEDHVRGSTLGVTAGAVIAEQFRVLRDGDRFYYENIFSGRQLEQIENTTLADIISRNTDIEFARGDNVFFTGGVEMERPGDDRDRSDSGRRGNEPGGMARGQNSAFVQNQAVDLAMLELEQERRRSLG